MSTDPTNTTPAPRSLRDFWTRYRGVLWPLVTSLVSALVGSVLTYFGAPPKVIERVTTVIERADVVPAKPLDEFSPTMGWHRDEAQIAINLDPDKTLHLVNTPAGKAALGDDDVFLWQAVRRVNNKAPPWYPNVNQGSVGCCVGAGFKHSADVCQATAIVSGKAFEWKAVSVEVIYAGSRVDVGGGRISGDGSTGAWAAQYVSQVGGIAAMQKYDSADLSTFSPQRARLWGRTGVPRDIATAAKEHPVRGAALVKTWSDVKRAIQQGYPVAVCSDQGFAMERDSTGRARPQGTWNHCMCICGVRTANDQRGEAAFILNSWGDNAHTGPVWPADALVAGFWADASVVAAMVRQGDSFALSDVQGFPARKIDWFVRAEPAVRNRLDLFAHVRRSEVCLSW